MRVRMRATTTIFLGTMKQGEEYDIPADAERRFQPYIKAGLAVVIEDASPAAADDGPSPDVVSDGPETAEAPEPETTARPQKKTARKSKATKKRSKTAKKKRSR